MKNIDTGTNEVVALREPQETQTQLLLLRPLGSALGLLSAPKVEVHTRILNKRCNLTVKSMWLFVNISHRRIAKRNRCHGISEVVSLKDFIQFPFFFFV